MLSIQPLYSRGGRLTFLLCTLFCITAKGQVVADFTTEIRQGCAPLVIHNFANLSSGDITNYFWDFGNGNTSTQPSPGTIYFSPGSYTVKLVVEDRSGRKDSMIKNNFIIVNEIPKIDFSVNNNSGCNPLTVQFTDQSNSGSANITNWEWDFGDGTTSSERSPAHTFTSNGDYTITLKASDNIGCGDVDTKSSFIHVNPSPKASFTATPAETCKPDLFDFVNTSTGGSLTTVQWDFGDGTSSTITNPLHKYSATGVYQVTLVVTNQNGCVDSITDVVKAVSLVPDFNGPGAVCQGAPAQFANTSTPTIASASWDFGDNTSSSNINPVKSFSAAGSFAIKLVNDFGGCKDSITKNITVLPKPTADFSFAAPPTSCVLPVDVSFTSQSVGAASYFWDFGDKATSTITDPTHTYTVYGVYAAKLVVTGSNGCTDSITKPKVVSIIPAKINGFNGLPYNGCVPSQQDFSAKITSPDPVASYLWNFGDGSTSTSPRPTNNYTTEGKYTVTLQITTVRGCVDNFTLPDAVKITTKPKADFTATQLNACASDTIGFTDMSTGTIDKWKWKFGDKDSSTSKNSFHRYSDSGFFSVKLIVGNVACFDTMTKSKFIFIKPPIARFTVQYDCAKPLIRTFENKSILAATSRWTFGDGEESTVVSPDHTYLSPGVYIVHLYVTGAGCSDNITDTIKIIDEHPNFTVNQTEVCRNNTVVFTVTNSTPQNIASYNWHFGDTSIVTKTSVANHNYLTPNVYTPTLSIKDVLGCTHTAGNPVAVTVYGPKADFANPSVACTNSTVTFTDQSRASGNHAITSLIFNYGDGKTDTTNTTTFSHIYSIPATYNAYLIVTDSYGCRDTLHKPKAITVTTAKASFSLNDSIFCHNSTLNFTNKSIGYKLSYLWNFGDGSTADTANASHTFSSEGIYNVSLVIKDFAGCVDSFSLKNGVTIGNAKAQFSMSDSVISCPPAQIKFIDNSMYSSSIIWNFDDGNFSRVANPTHYFSAAGTYHVKLITYGHGSCADSTVKDIIVKGPKGSFKYSPVFKCAPAAVNFTEDATDFNKNFTWDFGEGTTVTTSDASISHVYNEPGKYLPKLFLIDTGINCKVAVFGLDTITVSTASVYIKNYQNVFCDSARIQFLDSSILQYDTITSYKWTFGDGTSSNVQNPFHNYVSSGIYPVRLTIETSGGCIDSSSASSIKIVNTPQLKMTGPSTICAYQPAAFVGTSPQEGSSISWDWDFGNGNKYSISKPPLQAYGAAGTYPVTASVKNSSGCTRADTIILTVYPLPDLNATPDSVICRGASLTLHASGADSYVWSSNQSLSCSSCANPVISPVDSTAYYMVRGKNAITGCQKTDTTKITVVQPFKLSGMITDTLCAGETVRLAITGADHYMWSPSAGLNYDNVPDPVAKPETTTLFTVVGHDYRNCFADTGYVPITVYPIPVFNILNHNLSISAGNTVTLQTNSSPDITNWQWFPRTGLSCSNCPQPVATATNTINYKATVTNQGGCKAEDKVTINVFCNNSNVFIPNTFSPNNDGSNDVFYVRGKGIAGVRSIRIVNRWGVVVFEKSNFAANDLASGWDGTYNGKPVDADVFIYQAEVICETGQVFSFQGDITLIR